MKRLTEQLQSDEAVLLMFLAGELPEAEQAEVEGRLASDADLRARFEQMREVYAQVYAGMAQLDESSRLPGNGQEMAVKRVGRMMRQWQIDRMRAAANGNGQYKLSWWKVSSAAAAMILVGWVAWWGMTPATPFSDGGGGVPEYETRVQISDLMMSALQQENVAELDRLGSDLNNAGNDQSQAFWIDSNQDDDKPTG